LTWAGSKQPESPLIRRDGNVQTEDSISASRLAEMAAVEKLVELSHDQGQAAAAFRSGTKNAAGGGRKGEEDEPHVGGDHPTLTED